MRSFTALLSSGALLASFGACAGTQVVANGSFEPGLGGWTQAPATNNTGTATCSWNSASPAPGTETLTSTAGFAATDGSANAIGSNTQTTAGNTSCTLYQDITIPAGATTANFAADIGVKYLGGKTWNNAAIFYALYPTTRVPAYGDGRTLAFGGVYAYEPTVSSTALAHVSANNVNVAALAGQTVRLAFIIASDSTAGYTVQGVDNVSLDVTVPAPVPTLSEWAKIALAALLLGTGLVALRRRQG